MDDLISQLYELAPRFDEGKLFQSKEYRMVKSQQRDLYGLMIATFGKSLASMLNNYTDTLFDEMELEAQHFFREGFRAGRSLNQSQTPPLP